MAVLHVLILTLYMELPQSGVQSRSGQKIRLFPYTGIITTQVMLQTSTKKGTVPTIQFLGTSHRNTEDTTQSIFKICTTEGKKCVHPPTDVWTNHHTQEVEDDSALKKEILPRHHRTKPWKTL